LSNLVVFYVPIRYKYDVKQITSSSTSIAYSYNSSYTDDFNRKITGFMAPASQSIVNNLPQWMDLRKNTSSLGWQFVNSWGQNFETVLQNSSVAIENLHLETTRKTQKSKLFSIEISNRDLLLEKSFDNLLYNSGFTIKGPARKALPLGWNRFTRSDKTKVFLIDSRSYICPGTIVIDRVGSIGQVAYLGGESVQNLAASAYFFSEADNVSFNLLCIAELQDGTTRFSIAKTEETYSSWKRIHLVLPVNSKVYRAHFVLHSSSSGPVYINAPKLEISSSPTRWSKSPLDYLPYARASSNFSQVCAVQG